MNIIFFKETKHNKNVRLFKRFYIYHENLDSNERERLLGLYISHNTSKGSCVCIYLSSNGIFKQAK
jgi:hypothetical protein